MERLFLDCPVRHEGPNIKGWRSCLVLEPARDQNDWVWGTKYGDVPITPEIMAAKRRRIALVYKDCMFNEFEHVGILRAAGLRGVRISLLGNTRWPPFDGSSLALWLATMSHVSQGPKLRPYRPPVGLIHCSLPKDPSRATQYMGNGNNFKTLQLYGAVEFPSIKPGYYRFGHHCSTNDLRLLVRARTLGWPPRRHTLSRIASAFGWPHHNHIVWPQEHRPETVLEEIGRHRLLDMLAILNFAAPADSYLCGTLSSIKGGHATDLAVLKKLTSAKVLAFPRAA